MQRRSAVEKYGMVLNDLFEYIPYYVVLSSFMLSTNNILKLSDGKPVVSPTQDMVIGSYYMTMVREDGLSGASVREYLSEQSANPAE